MSLADSNPCLDCGACCATFRVSFYWSEAETLGLPTELTEQVNAWFACMRGTNQPQPRCAALAGTVGQQVGCTIYASRPRPCDELTEGSYSCHKARARHGLPPLALPDSGA